MENRVIALGFFDGVHLGHAALLSKTTQRARELRLTPSVLTFARHPDTVTGKAQVALINTASERCGIIRRGFGIDDILLWDFDAALMRMPWQDFLHRVTRELGARHLVAGYDYRFGHRGEGDARKLLDFAESAGITADIVDKIELDGETVSSTYIRSLISAGDMQRAARFLGHPHCMQGEVCKGVQLGRTLGLPTVNLRLPDGVVSPAFGVYATRVFIDERELTGVTNVGVRPTVAQNAAPNAETHILDFDGDLYGENVRIEFHKFLRPEARFDSVDALRRQIQADIEHTRGYFSAF